MSMLRKSHVFSVLMILALLTPVADSFAANVPLRYACELVLTSAEGFTIPKPVQDIQERFARSEAAAESFNRVLRKIQDAVSKKDLNSPRTLIVGPQIKSLDRIRQKIEAEHEGSPNRIHDILRAAFVGQDAKQISSILTEISRHMPVLKFRNRLSSSDHQVPPDIILTVSVPGTDEVAEIQVRHQLYQDRYEATHRIYDVVRSSVGHDAVEARQELQRQHSAIHAAIELKEKLSAFPRARVIYDNFRPRIDRLNRPVNLPKFQPAPTPAPTTLQVRTIRFMQRACSNKTGPDDALTVIDNAQDLRNGTLKVSDLPTIRVWRDTEERIWTQDLRRLAAFRLAGLKEVPVTWADPETVESRAFKFSTENDGKSILILVDGDLAVSVEDEQQ